MTKNNTLKNIISKLKRNNIISSISTKEEDSLVLKPITTKALYKNPFFYKGLFIHRAPKRKRTIKSSAIFKSRSIWKFSKIVGRFYNTFKIRGFKYTPYLLANSITRQAFRAAVGLKKKRLYRRFKKYRKLVRSRRYIRVKKKQIDFKTNAFKGYRALKDGTKIVPSTKSIFDFLQPSAIMLSELFKQRRFLFNQHVEDYPYPYKAPMSRATAYAYSNIDVENKSIELAERNIIRKHKFKLNDSTQRYKLQFKKMPRPYAKPFYYNKNKNNYKKPYNNYQKDFTAYSPNRTNTTNTHNNVNIKSSQKPNFQQKYQTNVQVQYQNSPKVSKTNYNKNIQNEVKVKDVSKKQPKSEQKNVVKKDNSLTQQPNKEQAKSIKKNNHQKNPIKNEKK